MQYMCLIYEDEKVWGGMSADEQKVMVGEYGGFTDSIRDKMVSCSPLQPTSTATTVRVRDGETLVTDGPFAETKEQLGGYYLIEAKDVDEALAMAARIPGARYGSVEVRPVLVFEQE